jgi:DNA-binding beta-propeller fold protein YncE
VNHDAGTLTAVDLGASEVLAEHVLDEAPLRAGPRTVSADGDGRLWVALVGADSVVALDAESGAEVARVDLGRGSAPYGVLWVGGSEAGSDGGGTVFVTLEGTGELVAIDSDDGEVLERVAVVDAEDGAPMGVRGLAYDPSRDRLWVTRFISPEGGGEVYPVEASTLAVGAPVVLAMETTPDTSNAGRGLPNYLSSVVVSPDGARAAVPSKKDNIERGLARDGQPLSVDNTVRTVVSFIDLDGGLDGGPGGGPGSGVELIEARIDLDNHDLANAAAYSPLGDLLFVASQGTNQVDVFDAYTGQLQTAFATGLAPQGLALTGDGRLVVQNFLSRSLGVYDIEPLLAGRDGVVRQLAEVVTVAEEPLAPEVLLGKQIFYNADSPQMSRDGYLSCASCHLDGGHDGRVWDFTDRGEGLRNTIDLRGRGGMRQGPLHWTGNFDEVQDFEGDIRRHFGGTGFLADADWDEASDSLGAGKGGRSAALDALAAYVATLDEVPPSPFGGGGAPSAGADEDDVAAGAALFVERGCADCHGGAEFTDSAEGVRHDVGTARTASGQRLGGPLDGFDTPTLRGVWATAPYLHNGSAPTLADALVGEAHVGDLDGGERDLLVAYLLTLDGDSAGVEEPGGPGLDEGGDAGDDMGSDLGTDAGADASDLGADGGAVSGGSRETEDGCAGCSAARRLPGSGSAWWVLPLLAGLALRRGRRG